MFDLEAVISKLWIMDFDMAKLHDTLYLLLVYTGTFDASISLHSHLVHCESRFRSLSQDRLAPTEPDDLCW